jgi:hypothetical protein
MCELGSMTPAELAAARTKAREAVRRGEPGSVSRLGDLMSEPILRTARLAPSWAQRIGYPNDYDRRSTQHHNVSRR